MSSTLCCGFLIFFDRVVALLLDMLTNQCRKVFFNFFVYNLDFLFPVFEKTVPFFVSISVGLDYETRYKPEYKTGYKQIVHPSSPPKVNYKNVM